MAASEQNSAHLQDNDDGEKLINDTQSKSSFKLNGWRATILIILGSLLIRYIIHLKLSHKRNADGFLQLVPEKYEDNELVEWQPAETPISRPEEPGNLGIAVVVPPDLKEEADNRFSEQQFNVVANELLPMNRSMRDVRYPECIDVEYPKKLPQVSVIIVYHNEAWSTLIRTIWSVITQSPKALLKEIVLVDDFSNKEYLGRQLQDYIRNFPVHIVLTRTISRVGLIQARLLGASKAKGKILVFLDAHCECIQGWLEALITPIVESRSTVAAPIIDVIDFNTMELRTAGINSRGSFDLSLTFTWDPIPQHVLDSLKNDRTAAIVSPAMAGGLFAIDREYFYKLGSYDEKMKIWGGENLEMSVRIWTCGGKLVSMPCSRVGHIFRDTSPYLLPGGADHVISHNLARMAEVWLDDYKNIFYAYNPRAFRERTNVTERKLLRNELECKPFDWFLDHVFQESPFKMENYRLVEIESLFEEESCLDSMGDSRVSNRNLEAKPCHGLGGNQVFMITGRQEIREKKYCLDATLPGEPVKLLDCHGEGGNQKWTHEEDTNMIKHSYGTNCLTLTADPDSDLLTIAVCDGSLSQQWLIHPPRSRENNLE